MPVDSNRKRKAFELFSTGKSEQAKKLLEKLRSKHPGDAEVLYMLGAIYGRQERFEDAERSLRAAVKAAPNLFPAHCDLGLALKEQAKFPEAEQAFRQALVIKPDALDVMLSLTATLLAMDRKADAERFLTSVYQRFPRSAEVLSALGEICQDRQEYEKAVDYYQQALAIRPNIAETHTKLGNVYRMFGRFKLSEEHLRKAAGIDDRLWGAHRGLILTLITSGRMDDAKQACSNILQVNPGHKQTLLLQAGIHQRLGEHQEAYDRIAPLLETDSQDSGVLQMYAIICQGLGRSEEAASRLEALLARSGLRREQTSAIHFQLGKIYDKMSRYDDAFRHYAQGNDMETDRFDLQRHVAFIEGLKSIFSREFMASAPRADTDSRRPIFIVGMPRSGTSLTEQILDSHPQVHGAGELSEINEIMMGLNVESGQAGGRLTADFINDRAGMYLQHLQDMNPDADRVTDKMPQNFLYLGMIELMFPGARIIHCRRDPRDTCLSIYFQAFHKAHPYAVRLGHLGHYYNSYLDLMQHWRDVLKLPVLEVRYEDLVADQEAQTRRLIEFIGLDWDERCLDFHESDRVVATASFEQVREPIYSRSAGRWQHYEKHLGPLLETLDPRALAGYRDTGAGADVTLTSGSQA